MSVSIKAGRDIVTTGSAFWARLVLGISAVYFLVDATTDHFVGFGNLDEK